MFHSMGECEALGLPPDLHKQGFFPIKGLGAMEQELFILLSFSMRFTFPTLNPVNFTA